MEFSSSEELEAALERSRQGARRDDADPTFRARVEAQLTKLATEPPSPTMPGEEFLAWAEREHELARRARRAG